jgi:uncharacterized protein with HEPN domain
MPPRTAKHPAHRLQDMLLAITAIERYSRGLTLSTMRRKPLVRDAIERNRERLSEASRHLPESVKRKKPEVPWRAIADLGDVLRHAYDRIDERVIWDTVTHDLPGLKLAVLDLQKSTSDPPG